MDRPRPRSTERSPAVGHDAGALNGLRPLRSLSAAERLNFLLTNRIPRHALTRFMGWYSRIENPLLARASIAVWRLFVDDLRLEEAQADRFSSLQACFTRALKAGARPVDPAPDVLISPVDAVVGAHGALDGLEALQAKGFPYAIDELLGDEQAAAVYRNGTYVTLRLKSSMYHRFHAPDRGGVHGIRYLSGDTWNVNPVALKMVERLFCRNERVVFPLVLENGDTVTLVAVAAILVASVHVHGLDRRLDTRLRDNRSLPLERRYERGEEMGWFEHGSTVVLLAPEGYELHAGLRAGSTVRMGRPLLKRPVR